MSPTQLVTRITAAAVAFAENKSDDDLTLIAAVLTQFADTLTTIMAQRDLCQKQAPQKSNDTNKNTNDSET